MSDKPKGTPERSKEPKDMIKMRGGALSDPNKALKHSASSGAISTVPTPEKKSSSSKKDLPLKKVEGDKKDEKKEEQPSPGKSKSPRSPRKIVVSTGSKSPGGSAHKSPSGSKSPKDSSSSRATSSGAPSSPSSSHKSDGSKSPKDGSKSPKGGTSSPKDGSKSPGSRIRTSRPEKKDEKGAKDDKAPQRKESKSHHAKGDDLHVKRTEESESSETSGTSGSSKQRPMKRAATVMSVSGSDAFLHARLAVVGSRDVWFSMLAQWQGIPLDPKDNPKTFLRTLKVDGKEYLVTAYDYTEKKERRLGANSYVFVFDSDHRDSFDMLRQYFEEISTTFAGQRFPCVLWNTKRIMDIYAEDLEDALDPADGADPEKIRQLARDLGTGLMPLVSSNVQEQLDVAFNAAIRQGLAYQKFQQVKDEKEKGKEAPKETKDAKDSKKK